MSDANVLEKAGRVPAGGALREAVDFRARLMELTQESHDAALVPREPGGLSHVLRAALALRIVRICNDAELEHHYAAMASDADAAAHGMPGSTSDEEPTSAILAYVDKVTRTPREASEADIARLRSAGVGESDIVRLAGLVAFVNYQCRVARVLRLLGEQP